MVLILETCLGTQMKSLSTQLSTSLEQTSEIQTTIIWYGNITNSIAQKDGAETEHHQSKPS